MALIIKTIYMKLSRKQELTYRLDISEMNKAVMKEKNLLKREAKRGELKKMLKEWYNKKYPRAVEL